MKFDSVTVVWGRQWSCSVDATSNGGIIIPESLTAAIGSQSRWMQRKKY